MIAAISSGALTTGVLIVAAMPVAWAASSLAGRFTAHADRHHLAACLDNDTKDTTP